jgi:hypothetical protein
MCVAGFPLSAVNDRSRDVSDEIATLWDGPLGFQEFAVREPIPLATIHTAVMEFLRGREDAVVIRAQAVNAYVAEPRMTQDVDILSPRAAELAEEIRRHLNAHFHVAVRVRDVQGGLGYRIYQVQKPKNRHLVDVRPVDALPPAQRVAEVLVVTPAELVAGKVRAYAHRRGQPKSFTDLRDVAVLLLQFPELKADPAVVRARLQAAGADPALLATWEELAAQEILPGEEDDEFTD